MPAGVDVGSALDLSAACSNGSAQRSSCRPPSRSATARRCGRSWSRASSPSAAGLLLDQITGPQERRRRQPARELPRRRPDLAAVPVFGALPFLLDGGPQLSNPIDAYFEAVSGFTATGATVAHRRRGADRSMLFWRQFSHWLGGMGIIILAVAVLPRLRIGGRQLLQSELAGPTEIERLAETIRETARRLWRSTRA